MTSSFLVKISCTVSSQDFFSITSRVVSRNSDEMRRHDNTFSDFHWNTERDRKRTRLAVVVRTGTFLFLCLSELTVCMRALQCRTRGVSKIFDFDIARCFSLTTAFILARVWRTPRCPDRHSHRWSTHSGLLLMRDTVAPPGLVGMH